MEQKYVPDDDFGSFLSSVQRAVNQSKSHEASMRIMHTLSQNKEERVAEMMTQVKVSWADFNDGLKYLEETGLVEMQDDDEGGLLRLTDEGLRWTQTMKMDSNDDDEGEH